MCGCESQLGSSAPEENRKTAGVIIAVLNYFRVSIFFCII